MGNNTGILLPQAETDASPPDANELALVKAIAERFDVALKTYQLFPAISVNVKTTLQALMDRFEAHWADRDCPIPLDTREGELRYKDEPVFGTVARSRNLAQLMNRDGLVRIVFHQGLERSELTAFMGVFLEMESAENPDDDFVTLLWEKDCTHIQTVAFDALLDADLLPRIPTAAEMAERRYESVPARPGDGADAGFGWLSGNDVPADLLNLDSTELGSLLARVRDECAAPAVLELVDTLVDACRADKTPDTLVAAVEVAGKTIEAAVLRKNFCHAHALLRDLRARFEPALVDPACAALASDEPMATVVAILEDEQVHPGKELFEYMRELGAPAVKPLGDIFLRGVRCAELLPILADLAGAADFGSFAHGLLSTDATVILHTIDLLLGIDPERSRAGLRKLFRHRDTDVRVRSLTILSEQEDATAQKGILELLNHGERSVRIAALASLNKCPFRHAFETLWRRYLSRGGPLRRGFRVSESAYRAEQQQLLGAVVRADPTEAIKRFIPILRHRTWLWWRREALRAQQEELVFALSKVSGRKAGAALSKLAKEGSSHVRQLCRTALQSMQERLRYEQ